MHYDVLSDTIKLSKKSFSVNVRKISLTLPVKCLKRVNILLKK